MSNAKSTSSSRMILEKCNTSFLAPIPRRFPSEQVDTTCELVTRKPSFTAKPVPAPTPGQVISQIDVIAFLCLSPAASKTNFESTDVGTEDGIWTWAKAPEYITRNMVNKTRHTIVIPRYYGLSR